MYFLRQTTSIIHSYSILASLLTILQLLLLQCPGFSHAAKRTIDTAKVKEVEFDGEQRIVNWCVTGEDEPEFGFYPFNQFTPYLKKTEEGLVRQKDSSGITKYDYDFDITAPRYKEESSLKGELQNIGHIRFKAKILRESAEGIKEILKPKEIEGLMVQVNWAPQGIGLPGDFAFVDPNVDIICFDCLHHYGVPVGCRRRTYNNLVHPTILVYHHKLKSSKAHKARLAEFLQVTKDDEEAADARNKNRTDRIAAAGGGPPPSSTTPRPKDKCLTKFDPRPECDFSGGSGGGGGGGGGGGVGGGGNTKKTLKELQEERNRDGAFLGTTDEIHGTFQWFLPPGSTTKGIEFQMLVVHSFATNEYEVFKLGPYEIPEYLVRATSLNVNIKHNPFIPSPYFYGFRQKVICDDFEQNTVLFSMNDFNLKYRHPFDYSRSYEKCMKNIDGFKSNPDDSVQVCERPEPLKVNHAAARFIEKPDIKCSKLQCESSITTTESPKGDGRPKRTIHGGINMVTNFCLQPIFIFIGRYYKETFNVYECKGNKLWFWFHMLGGGAASICQYIGFFHPKYVEGSHHVIAGNIMIMVLAFTYVSAWIRHKGRAWTSVAEFIHGFSGYAVSILAYWCLHTAPGVSNAALILVYVTTGILLIGYIIMECCLCCLDCKFGMHPRRCHFPTIQSRFDDIRVPYRGQRIALLICITIPMLALTIVSSFV